MRDPRDQPPIGEDDLQAYVDERLDAARLARVRRYLEEQPEAAARVRAMVAQRDALRAALAPKASEPIPVRLRVAHLRAGLRRRRWRRLRGVAAAVLLVLLGAGAGWLARGGWGGTAVPAAPPMAEAAEAHRLFAQETRRAVLPAAADAGDLSDWLSDRLGAPVVVPDLLGAGYRPLDGHLLPSPQGTAAVVMYERIGGRTRLSFYVRPAPGTPADRLRCADHPGGYVTYYWFDGRFGYAVTAALPRDELRGIAHAAEREVREGPRPRAATRLASGQPVPRVCLG
ncbi:anti-sigma factor family protein [Caldovatus aquaticus]|uniref:Anti-sigma factor n=1 Tax=Caldovatus aquaticus TaxID=2865671 RepID=A0ABS7F3V7_9PROT|nr:anti-sigma factor [Caldovatus aquaticus]MBW8270294.1 anti-sigma factor [Caldovatus aquaticus]